MAGLVEAGEGEGGRAEEGGGREQCSQQRDGGLHQHPGPGAGGGGGGAVGHPH